MTTPPMARGLGRRGMLLAASTALVTLPACLEHPLKDVEYENLSEIEAGVALTVNKNVDILFVIDNSGSMGEEQATLAANFEGFIEVLEREDVKAHYRIGITTTDNGNPLCDGTDPEGGKLVLSSCRSRTQDFVFSGDNPVDATEAACLEVCPEQWANIETLPTRVDPDGEAAPRPWIENIGGVTNLPEGLSTVQAFQCLGPQGVNGCGFEEHLESMHKALTRANTDSEASYGFLRDDAILAVVFVTDEADCSFNKDHGEVFLPSGDRTLWSNPTEGSPTSAVCWNAGVVCSGEGGSYDECHSANIGVDGQPVDDANADADAVLRPLSRYTSFLQSLEEAKQKITANQEVLVALIGGVGDSGEPTYADSVADPVFQTDFGIGPGCQSAAGRAVPPVRLAEFAEEFQTGDEQNMFSICNPDYRDALKAIAERIADQVKPACMERCVADTDPTTETLDPQCTLEQAAPQSDGRIEETQVPPCTADGELPGDDVNVCYIVKSDKALDLDGRPLELTPDSTIDDMSPECAEEGWNLEFELVRRDGFPPPPNTSVTATCQLSQAKALDCPQLK